MKSIGCTYTEAKEMPIMDAQFFIDVDTEIALKHKREMEKKTKRKRFGRRGR